MKLQNDPQVIWIRVLTTANLLMLKQHGSFSVNWEHLQEILVAAVVVVVVVVAAVNQIYT
jgi:hypothetical protein